jgi:hypothetical protein
MRSGLVPAAVCLALGLLIGPAAASAQDVQMLTPQERIAKNRAYQLKAQGTEDRNRDGRLDLSEWLSKEWAFLLEYDSDHDGRLSLAEYFAIYCFAPSVGGTEATYASCTRTRRDEFGAASRAPNFFITQDVYSAVARRYFENNDRNRDGFVSEADR